MMKRIIIHILATLALLAGCAKETGLGDADSITVQATIGQMTKVDYTADGIGTSFTAGDKIAVYGWIGSSDEVPATRVVDGVENTLGTDGKWTPESPMLWKNVKDQHYFLGVFPARTITDFTADPYTLDPAKYEESDLLVATNVLGLKAQGNPVALSFDHALAKLVVNLKFRSQWETEPTVTSVTAMAKKTATVNYLAEAKLTATGTAEAVALSVSKSNTWSGLQVPQEGVRRVIVTINNKEYVYESATDIPLNAGQYTTLDLMVGRDRIELGSISVTDWAAGTVLPDGEAELQKTHESVDMGNGLKWATCNIGAENPEDYGDYFDWGATVPYYQAGHSQDNPCADWIDGKDGYNWANYSFMEAGQSSWKRITKYTFADNQKDGTWWYDGDTFKGDNGDGVEHKDFASYDYADDAARQNWGGNWRTPTDAEWTWLCDENNCDWLWTTQNGVNGMLVTSKINGNKIFLPAAGYRGNAYLYDAGSYGYYWSSSLYESLSDSARNVGFYSGGVFSYGDGRCYGQSVRPVIN